MNFPTKLEGISNQFSQLSYCKCLAVLYQSPREDKLHAKPVRSQLFLPEILISKKVAYAMLQKQMDMLSKHIYPILRYLLLFTLHYQKKNSSLHLLGQFHSNTTKFIFKDKLSVLIHPTTTTPPPQKKKKKSLKLEILQISQLSLHRDTSL